MHGENKSIAASENIFLAATAYAWHMSMLYKIQSYAMQEADALLGTCGIENKFNSCWLISSIQLLNSTALHKFLCGE